MSNLADYRQSESERVRIDDLFTLVPPQGRLALDVGARDVFLSRRLADRCDRVVALDLQQPAIEHSRIDCVRGDASELPYQDRSFDVVLCAEVLEHIPRPTLERVCRELVRVTGGTLVIGVPLAQDLRCGETTCAQCGGFNPPWGHVNAFDEAGLRQLFAGLQHRRTQYAWNSRARTNPLSAALLRFAGNPYGTYMQEEPCVHCGGALGNPRERGLSQKVATKLAVLMNAAQRAVQSPRPMWIHVQFQRD